MTVVRLAQVRTTFGGFVLLGLAIVLTSPAYAQTPRETPAPGYGLHDERDVGPFVVQRWVSTASPEVSPAGMCFCITVIYVGSNHVLTVGSPGEIAAYTVTDLSGFDVSGNGLADLVVSAWSGGAHCCYSTAIYSVGTELRTLLSLSTGHCGPGEFTDLDGNGTREFVTCDDAWAYAYCSFADSPFPRVVYAYDPERGEYVPATPRFALRFRDELAARLVEAQAWMSRSSGKDTGLDKCRLLQPVLGLMYTGRVDDAVVLIRGLYKNADREQFEQETLGRARGSSRWVPR